MIFGVYFILYLPQVLYFLLDIFGQAFFCSLCLKYTKFELVLFQFNFVFLAATETLQHLFSFEQPTFVFKWYKNYSFFFFWCKRITSVSFIVRCKNDKAGYIHYIYKDNVWKVVFLSLSTYVISLYMNYVGDDSFFNWLNISQINILC